MVRRHVVDGLPGCAVVLRAIEPVHLRACKHQPVGEERRRHGNAQHRRVGGQASARRPGPRLIDAAHDPALRLRPANNTSAEWGATASAVISASANSGPYPFHDPPRLSEI